MISGLFSYLCRASFIILYNDQQMHNYFTNYHTSPTCFDTTVSSSGSSISVPCQVTLVFQMQLFVIQIKIISHRLYAVEISMLKILKILQLSYL